jgi:MFS family permease
LESSVTRHSATQQSAILELLSERDFAFLWLGQLLSQVGDQCLLIAAITLITSFSASPLAILIPALSMVLPQVFFGLLGGVVADRWNRKAVMIISDILRAILVLAVLLVRTPGQLWILYLAAAGLAVIGSFFYPARNATIPNLVPNGLLLAANGLIQGSYVIALIVGPVLAGVLVELGGMESAIALDSATFLASAVMVSLIRLPVKENEGAVSTRNDMWEDMKEGLAFIRHSRPLRRALYVTAVATLGIGSVVLLAITHLETQFDAGGLKYAGTMSMLGIGSVIGGLIVTRLSRSASTSQIIGGMLITAGLAIVVFAFAPYYAVVLGSVMVLGMCIVIARGALDTTTQALAPDQIRGRVQAAVNLIVAGGTVLAEGFSAVLGHFLGVQLVFAAAGLVTVIAGIVSIYALKETVALSQQA